MSCLTLTLSKLASQYLFISQFWNQICDFCKNLIRFKIQEAFCNLTFLGFLLQSTLSVSVYV